MATKGINMSEGVNRLRFEKISKRLQRVNVDIVHRTYAPGSLQPNPTAAPETGSRGCHFQDELEERKRLDTAASFQRFHYTVFPLVQSLPELLHHQIIVVNALQTHILAARVEELPSYLHLVAVLARDLQEDLGQHFHGLLKVLAKALDATASGSVKTTAEANPEIVGKLFECISYLLKYQLKTLVEDPDSLRVYYGHLLGHSSHYVREFAAKSISLVLRKLDSKLFKSHSNKLLKSLSANVSKSYDDAAAIIIFPLEDRSVESELQYSKKIRDITDGIAQLFCASIKGIKSKMHSQGAKKLNILLNFVIPMPSAIAEAIIALPKDVEVSGSKKSTKKNAASEPKEVFSPEILVYLNQSHETLLQSTMASGQVMCGALAQLFRYLHPCNSLDVWQTLCGVQNRLVKTRNAIDKLKALNRCPALVEQAVTRASLFVVEMMYFALVHSDGRGLSDMKVKKSCAQIVITSTLSLLQSTLNTAVCSTDVTHSGHLIQRSRLLFCKLWLCFSTNNKLLTVVAQPLQDIAASLHPTAGLLVLADHLLPHLAEAQLRRHLVRPMICALATMAQDVNCRISSWLAICIQVLFKLRDNRPVSCALTAHKSPPPADEGMTEDDDWQYQDEDDDDDDDDDYSEDGVINDQKKSSSHHSIDVELKKVLHNSSSELSVISLACFDFILKSISEDNAYSIVAAFCAEDHAVFSLSCLCLTWMCVEYPQALECAQVQIERLYRMFCDILLLGVPENVTPVVANFINRLSDVVCSSCKLMVSLKQVEAKLSSDIVVLQCELLLCKSDSLSSSWGLFAALNRLQLLATTESPFCIPFSNLKVQELMECGGKALSSPSYWLRSNYLQILKFLPPATLLLQEASNSADPARVNVIELCLEAAQLPVALKSEREFARRMSTLEVLIRTGRLPLSFARIVCGFCLGVLHIKFKPFWEPAILVLVAASSRDDCENVMWPLLISSLNFLGGKSIVFARTNHVLTPVFVNKESIATQSVINDLETLLHDQVDNGVDSVEMEIANSFVFYSRVHLTALSATVMPDARADHDTAYGTMWSVLKRCPVITLRRSKVIVGIFLQFLCSQYYKTFHDDPEIPFLRHIGLFDAVSKFTDKGITEHLGDGAVVPTLSMKVLKFRLGMFLQVFAPITSPKQLYQHELLFGYFTTILSKPETNIAKLALDCMLTYKPAYLIPFQDKIKKLMDDKALRNEMISFDLSPNDSIIDTKLRDDLVPVIIRVVFGRFVSKARGSKTAKDLSLTRRVAVLTFLNNLTGLELRHFVHLMFRGILPRQHLLNLSPGNAAVVPINTRSVQHQSLQWYDLVDALIEKLSSRDFNDVSWDRQIGYLHLLENVIKIFGCGVSAYVGQLTRVVMLLLIAAHNKKQAFLGTDQVLIEDDLEVDGDDHVDSDDDEEEDKNNAKSDNDHDVAVSQRDGIMMANQSSRVRTMCLLRLSEFVHQFHSNFDFTLVMNSFFDGMGALLEALPMSIGGISRMPALLRVIYALVQYSSTVALVATREAVIIAVIRCVSSKAVHDVVKVVMEILTRLLEHGNGCAILPHASLIIQAFSRRFVGPSFCSDTMQLKLSDMRVSPNGSIKQELKFLCQVAESIFSRTDVVIGSQAVTNLATLLLGMLRTYTTTRKVKVEEEWALHILTIYKSLVWRMDDVTPHIPFISRLFGPAGHPQSLFNLSTVRTVLTEVYATLATHASTHSRVDTSSTAIQNLTAIDSTMLSNNNKNYGRCIPVFQALSGELFQHDHDQLTWSKLMGPDNCKNSRESSICNVVLHECIRCMYDEDFIIRSAALASLKKFVVEIGVWSGLILADESSDTETVICLDWIEVLTSVLMPQIRLGLKGSSSDNVKRQFVMLLGHCVLKLGTTAYGQQNPQLFHGDMMCLLHEDPEQSFFENICHIQIHRRVRALAKLRAMLMADSAASPFHQFTFVNVLLPIGFHPLTSNEFVKKDHGVLLQEAAGFIGSVSSHLPWSHYYTCLKALLKQLDKNNVKKEKVLLSALCSLLQSFHFDMTGGLEAEGLKIPTRDEALFANVREECVDENGHFNGEDMEDIVMTESNVTKPIVSAPAATAGPDEDGEDIVVEEADVDAEVAPTAAAVTGNITTTSANVVRTVVNSVLPWVKVYLMKQSEDEKGNKTKSIRPQIAVALAHLIQRLQAPVVSEQKKASLFSNLVITVVGTLKSRDSAVRDIARDSLAKMVQAMGLNSLQPVLYEMQHMLTEGYQRHVCCYSVKTILFTVLENYEPPCHAPSVPLADDGSGFDEASIVRPEFDQCLSSVMETVLSDLLGDMHEDRTVDGADRSLIREAKGSKANEILEICARCLLFRPTYALKSPANPSLVSSVHCLSSPLLMALSRSETNENLGKVGEALQRIGIGLAKNKSVIPQELLLYLHATLQPFVVAIIRAHKVHKCAGGMKLESFTDNAQAILGEDFDTEETLPSYLEEYSSDEDNKLYNKNKQSRARSDNVTGHRPATWLPTDRKSLSDQRLILEERDRERRELLTVQDGASAPKLTGYNRHKRGRESGGQDSSGAGTAETVDPSAVAAVRFCLSLFNSSLKHNMFDSKNEDLRAMASPFLPLLGQCLRLPGVTNVVAAAMRCLCTLLTWELPVESHFSCAVGSRMLKLMFRGGALVSTDNELVQACIKGMTSLFTTYNKNVASANKAKLPLTESNIRTLLEMLTVSVMEVASTYQNTAFQLIRAIIDSRMLVPELYDLINKVTELIVLSHYKGVREAASSAVVAFILNYPLGDKRFAGQMKQLLSNCAYVYEDGRKAALEMLSVLTRLLPVPVLDANAQVLFFPMAMQVVNDASATCRSAAGDVIIVMCRRVDPEIFAEFVGYGIKWLSTRVEDHTTQSRALVRTGAQAVGLLVMSRPDAFKKSQTLQSIIDKLQESLYELLLTSGELSETNRRRGSLEKREMAKFDEGCQGEDEGVEPWVVIYQLLILLERLLSQLSGATNFAMCHQSKSEIANRPTCVMELVEEAMMFPHAWVRTVACRVVQMYLARRDVSRSRLCMYNDGTELLLQPNGLYQLARRLCIVLNQPHLSDGLLQSLTASLTIVVRALYHNPDLCSNSEATQDNKYDEANEDVMTRQSTNDNNDNDNDDMEDQGDEEDAENVDLEQDEHNEVVDNEDDDEEEAVEDEQVQENETQEQVIGSSWVMQRLRSIGNDSRGLRRLYVLKIFACIVAAEEEFAAAHLSQMVDVAVRCQLTSTGPDEAALAIIKEAALGLLDLLEKKVGSAKYIGVYSDIQKRIQLKKHDIKSSYAIEAVRNPRAHALRKIEHTMDKANSKHRKALGHMAVRGLTSRSDKRDGRGGKAGDDSGGRAGRKAAAEPHTNNKSRNSGGLGKHQSSRNNDNKFNKRSKK